MANTGLLELNGKDIVDVINEEAVPRSGDIDATTYNQKNHTISGSSYTITKDSPDVIYLELTGDFAFTCTGAVNANRTIKVQIHKAASVASTTNIAWNGVTEWLTDGNSAPTFGQVASQEQNLVVAVCLSNTVVLGNTLYNSENGVSGGSVTIANVSGLQDALDAKADTTALNTKADSSALANYLPLAGGTVTGNLTVNGTITGSLSGNASTATTATNATNATNANHATTADTATNANHATTADTATNATKATTATNANHAATADNATNANHATTAGSATDATKIAISGSRGRLAGYEQCQTVTSLTLTSSSSDSNDYNSTSAITVNNGTAGTCWTKTIKLSKVPSAVNFGASWNWVGGSAPTMVVNGLLVCTWQNNHGLINFLSPSA